MNSTTNNQQPTTNNQQPTTNNQQPTTNNQVNHFPIGKKILFSFVILVALAVSITLLGELILRTFYSEQYIKPDIPPPYDTAQKDDLLGWKMTPGYAWQGTMKDFGGNEYSVDLQYDENGFKAFGDTLSGKKKVWFIGDSYTASVEVSNGKTFYNLIRDSLDIEVFACGHAGYGTLQEYMLLDKWVDVIKPDLVIWQTCSNDFIDNYAPLEIVCGYKVGERRPYLNDGDGIFYDTPLSRWQKMKKKIHFYEWLDERYRVAIEKLFDLEYRVGEYYIATEKRNFRPYDEAVTVTQNILQKVLSRLPEGTRLTGFSADLHLPQLDDFKALFEEQGLVFITDATYFLEIKQIEEGIVAKSIDGYHWNETGHEIMASGLLPFIQSALSADAASKLEKMSN